MLQCIHQADYLNNVDWLMKQSILEVLFTQELQ
jgi:hypothetical protein